MMIWQRLRLCISLVAIVFCADGLTVEPAVALIVPSSGTTTAPPGNPYWSNHNLPGNSNYVYLGNGWALSARHPGPEPTNPNQTLTFSTGSHQIIPNLNYVVPNPTTYVNSSGQTVAFPFTLSAQTDLRLVRLGSDPNLPEICASRANCNIASTSPSVTSQVMFVGHGPSRNAESGSGYTVNVNDSVQRWGTNLIENTNNANGIFPSSPSNRKLTSTTGILALFTPGDGVTRDVLSLYSDYDHAPPTTATSPFTTTEAQAFAGDSGSSVYYHNTTDNKWYLAGIVNAAYMFQGQTAGTVQQGNLTTFADLSYYRETILRMMETLQADVNMDGVLTGTTPGGMPTGDIMAFVNGWGYDNGLGIGTPQSWTHGDLSRDGKTDYADFIIMRQALAASGLGGGSQLESLLGLSVGVPEPTSLVLAAISAAFFAFRRRR
jgi:hypothetical protein